MKIVSILVSLIYHSLAVVLILAIIVAGYIVLTGQENTPANRDYNRLVADFKDVSKSDGAISITVPLEASEPFLIVAYPPDEAPPACSNKACVCSYRHREGSYLEECKIFGNVRDCPEGCSDKSCLVGRVEVPSKKQITISRDECGRLSLT